MDDFNLDIEDIFVIKLNPEKKLETLQVEKKLKRKITFELCD